MRKENKGRFGATQRRKTEGEKDTKKEREEEKERDREREKKRKNCLHGHRLNVGAETTHYKNICGTLLWIGAKWTNSGWEWILMALEL